MIGVISKASETAMVEEFFELFKTPWEFFYEGRAYDAIVTSTDQIPLTGAKAILIYGTESKPCDAGLGIKAGSILHGATVETKGRALPIYGELLRFEADGTGVLSRQGTAEIAGVRVNAPGGTIHRFGYDLFAEVRCLLGSGQPAEQAHIPALELHIAIMRDSLLESGVEVVEIPPVPAGYEYTVCLTHDIDFVGIRRHKLDHTMWGFLYRSTLGALLDLGRGRISVGRALKRFQAAALLPLVYLKLAEDYWMPFEWYLKLEKGLSATYFLIPFKNRPGTNLMTKHAERRATAYDIMDLGEWIGKLKEEGCEIGVHGIDAWHSVGKGREELRRITEATGQARAGVRMHWLLRDENTGRVLDEAGYTYDSTAGYNETVGYRCGTTQAFRPMGVRSLMELPLHIQDGALFYPQKLNLSEGEAWERCQSIIENAKQFGGVVTILWHDRSPGPERFWGEFYSRLVKDLKAQNVWFTSGSEAVNWFRTRREVRFERDDANGGGVRAKAGAERRAGSPDMVVRIQTSQRGELKRTDRAWNGVREIDLDGRARGTISVGRAVATAGATD